MAIVHSMVQLQRRLALPAARVFDAWRDPEALQRWYVPGDETWSSTIQEHLFEVGGRKHLIFGPQGSLPYEEDCRYELIVPDSRIIFSMRISVGNVPQTVSLVTIELTPSDGSTFIQVTDQLAALDGGDSHEGREKGWNEVLDKLQSHLQRETVPG